MAEERRQVKGRREGPELKYPTDMLRREAARLSARHPHLSPKYGHLLAVYPQAIHLDHDDAGDERRGRGDQDSDNDGNYGDDIDNDNDNAIDEEEEWLRGGRAGTLYMFQRAILFLAPREGREQQEEQSWTWPWNEVGKLDVIRDSSATGIYPVIAFRSSKSAKELRFQTASGETREELAKFLRRLQAVRERYFHLDDAKEDIDKMDAHNVKGIDDNNVDDDHDGGDDAREEEMDNLALAWRALYHRSQSSLALSASSTLSSSPSSSSASSPSPTALSASSPLSLRSPNVSREEGDTLEDAELRQLALQRFPKVRGTDNEAAATDGIIESLEAAQAIERTLESRDLDVRLPVPAHVGFELLFGRDEAVLRPLHVLRKSQNLQLSPWTHLGVGGERTLSYGVPMDNALLRGKVAKCQERLRIGRFVPGHCYWVHVQAVTPGVPFGDAFSVHSLYAIEALSERACRLQAFVGMHWHRSPLLKAVIRATTMRSFADYCRTLRRLLLDKARHVQGLLVRAAAKDRGAEAAVDQAVADADAAEALVDEALLAREERMTGFWSGRILVQLSLLLVGMAALWWYLWRHSPSSSPSSSWEVRTIHKYQRTLPQLSMADDQIMDNRVQDGDAVIGRIGREWQQWRALRQRRALLHWLRLQLDAHRCLLPSPSPQGDKGKDRDKDKEQETLAICRMLLTDWKHLLGLLSSSH
jgi:hypothetical protein